MIIFDIYFYACYNTSTLRKKREDFMTNLVDFKAKINALNENINGLKFEYDQVKKAQENNETPDDRSRFYCIMSNYLVKKFMME